MFETTKYGYFTMLIYGDNFNDPSLVVKNTFFTLPILKCKHEPP